MEVQRQHAWPTTKTEALAIQDRLRPLLNLTDPGPEAIRLVAGLDVAYATSSPDPAHSRPSPNALDSAPPTGGGPSVAPSAGPVKWSGILGTSSRRAGDEERLAAAVVVLDAMTLQVVEESVVTGAAAFPYVPGLFAFRELPALVEALEKLTVTPDLLICDGHGLAHPRRFGLACHLGVLTGLPALGVGKTHLLGSYETPGEERGAYADLRDGGETVGRVLRTRRGVKPVYVSVGHRIDLDTACRHVLALSPRYRLPETTRRADRLSRAALTR